VAVHSAATSIYKGSDLGGIAAATVFVQRAPTTVDNVSHALSPSVLLAVVLVPACVAAGILSCMLCRMCCAFRNFDVLKAEKWRALERKRAATLY
jgi:hypothetical protein